MKLVAAIILLGGLTAAALWAPYQGRTLWQRAEEKGVPSATAHAVSAAARSVGSAAGSALRWATSSKAPAAPAPPEKKPVARKAEKKPAAPAPRPDPKDAQPAPAASRAASAPAAGPVVPQQVASERARTVALAPLPVVPPAATGSDKIVRTAAPEKLSSGDRAALDQLVAKARR